VTAFTRDQLVRMKIDHAFDPHPVLPLPDLAAMSARGWTPAQVHDALQRRHAAIARQQTSPLLYGWEPESWKKAREVLEAMRVKNPKGVLQLYLSGGNRSSKSEFAAKWIMQHLVSVPKSKAWILQSNESASISEQQPYLWKYFPPEWKPASGKLVKGAQDNISYKQKTGFSGNGFILPNGSSLAAKFYSVEVGSIEGVEIDRAWADELIPMKWVDPLLYRLATRNGARRGSQVPHQKGLFLTRWMDAMSWKVQASVLIQWGKVGVNFGLVEGLGYCGGLWRTGGLFPWVRIPPPRLSHSLRGMWFRLGGSTNACNSFPGWNREENQNFRHSKGVDPVRFAGTMTGLTCFFAVSRLYA
jgi:hypothetical protein